MTWTHDLDPEKPDYTPTLVCLLAHRKRRNLYEMGRNFLI